MLNLHQINTSSNQLLQAFSEREKAVAITNAERKLVYVNDAFLEMIGYKHNEVIGRKPSFLQGDLTTYDSIQYLKQKLIERLPFEADVINYKKNGEAYICHINIEPLFLNGMLTHYIAYEENIETITKPTFSIDDEVRYEKVKSYFETSLHYTNPYLQVSDVADATHLQSRCVGRVLRIFEEKSFNEYLNEYRIKQVLQMLKYNNKNNYTLAHISKVCGFNSKSVFNTAFKNYTGVTPSVYVSSAKERKVKYEA
jgi:PAS domain S-box-containing protein